MAVLSPTLWILGTELVLICLYQQVPLPLHQPLQLSVEFTFKSDIQVHACNLSAEGQRRADSPELTGQQPVLMLV